MIRCPSLSLAASSIVLALAAHSVVGCAGPALAPEDQTGSIAIAHDAPVHDRTDSVLAAREGSREAMLEQAPLVDTVLRPTPVDDGRDAAPTSPPADHGAAPTPAPRAPLPDDMVEIPGGVFKMGCAAGDPYCAESAHVEQPQHAVMVSAFYMDTVEVSVAQYARCLLAGRCGPPQSGAGTTNWGRTDREDHPINGITWQDAHDYCAFVGRRLPTEAEWERAARGGLDDAMYTWGNEEPVCLTTNRAITSNTIASADPYQGCLTDDHSASVGASLPNAFGLRDMLGNVSEFTSTVFHFYASEAQTDPQGPTAPTEGDVLHVQRGCLFGSGGSMASQCRVSARWTVGMSDNGAANGIRCAMSP